MPSERELEIKLLLSDSEALSRLNAALKKIEGDSKKSADSMNLSWAGFAAKLEVAEKALRPVIDFMRGAVTAAIEQEDAVNRLNAALTSQGTFTEELSAKYQALAQSLQANSRFSDEAIIAVEQRLVAIGNVGPGAMERTTQAVLDLATSLRLDLETASTLVAKAAEGNTSALSRYGIKIDESIPKGERYAKVLELIQQRFGGSAQRDVETFGGATAQLKNAWNEFLEEIGGLITKSPQVNEAIRGTTALLNDFTKILKELDPKKIGEFFDTFNAGFTSLGAKLADQINSLQAMTAGFAGIGAGLGAGPFGMLGKLFMGDDPSATAAIIQETQTQIQEQAKASQDAFDQEMQARKTAFQAQEFESHVASERQKIDSMRQMWLAWNNEKSAQTLAQLQHETEFLTAALDVQKKAHESIWPSIIKLRDTFSAGMSQVFIDMIKGTANVKEAFTNLGFQMLKILIDYALQLAINAALAKVMMAAQLASSSAAAAATAAAWAIPAALVSLATFGANAIPAAAGISSVTALTTSLAALSAAVSGVSGLQEGGIIQRGGSVLVGERGPELLDLPRGARVTPLERLSPAGSGALYVNIEINNPMFTPDDLGDQILNLIAPRISEFLAVEKRRL